MYGVNACKKWPQNICKKIHESCTEKKIRETGFYEIH
jgi:hypothetical protein